MTRVARIHQPPRSAMQSGLGATQHWVLSFPATGPKRLDPLTGWWGSGDTVGTEVTLRFPTRQEAVAYAQARGLAFEIEEPPAPRPIKPKVYADNFKFGRATNWTH